MHQFHLLIAVVSCLVTTSAFGADLIPLNSFWRFLPGTQEATPSNPAAWRFIEYSDASWAMAPAPFWYGDPQPATGTELGDMQGHYTSVFLRQSFTISNVSAIEQLELGAQSDDGFIAWLNGVEIARFNMPAGDVAYDDSSLGALPEPVPFQQFPVQNPQEILVEGANILSVHAFNSSLDASSDFVINVQLQANTDVTTPELKIVLPQPGRTLPALTQIELLFSEPVTGVDALDLLINGAPATSVVALTAVDYLFAFPEPAAGTVTVAWDPDHGITDQSIGANPFAGGGWSYTLDPESFLTGLVLTEFMAANDRTIRDAFGDSSDWIEIFNDSDQSVNLLGWSLSDSDADLRKWIFPEITLPAREYLLVFASGRDLTNPAGQLHTNFRLARDGGFLALVSPNGRIASAFAPAYPPQETDVSYGRDQLSPQLVGYFINPTPGGPNANAGLGFAPAVQFSAVSGTFMEPFQLVLSPDQSQPNLVIRYTLDGSPVSEFSPVYSTPLALSTSTRVRARAFLAELWPGPERTEFYVAVSADAGRFTTDLPIIVLHNEGAGEVPAFWDQPVWVQTFEPIDGVTSLTNPPALSSHGIFHLRGSSTLFYPKGSFFLETQDALGFPRNVSILDLPAESDWVLYAPNNFEPVLIHNPVAFELSRQMGQYASRSRFAVVFLNVSGGPITAANYNGIYVLTEKIKADDARVDIEKMGPQDSQPPEVTGGYLLSVDRPAIDEGQIYAGDQALNVLEPRFWEIHSPERAAQLSYIVNYLDSFYTALTGPNWLDPVTGYAAYIDVPAAIDHHIHGVVTFNVDALRLSGYLHKPRNGKIIMGPVWDFDRTQGSTDSRDFNPRVWRSRVGDRGTDMFNPGNTYHNPWYSRMFFDVDFWQAWVDRYQELRDTALSISNLHAILDAYANQVRTEQPREVIRWGVRPRNGRVTLDGFTHVFDGTYQGEIDWMKRWYNERLNFIDGNLLARPQLNVPPGPISSPTTLNLASTEVGTIYYTLDGSDPRLTGGAISPLALVYSGPITLSRNARIVARVHNPQHQNQTGPGAPPLSTPWSGRAAATYVVTTPPLVVSEIMFHPVAPTAGDPTAAEEFEFIELLNRGTGMLDLVGFHFTNGIAFTFTEASPITQLAPGERVVLVKNVDAFGQRYPGNARVAGVYSGSLDNSGERIELVGPLLEPILDFAYDDHWYRATDGRGFSLVIRDESAPFNTWNDSGAWRVSAQPGGSPGAPDPAPGSIPAVLVNEVLAHTDPPDQDSIELHNPGATDANVSGWWLSDDLDEPFKFQLPPGSIMTPGAFLVFTESQFTNDASSSFRLSSLGDQIFLIATDGGTNLTGHIHGFEFGASFNAVSIGRHVISTGQDRFVSQSRRTLAETNAGPRISPVVINEIMIAPSPQPHPENAALGEYVELHNHAAEPVPLYDPLFPTNTWRLRGAIDYDFPVGTVLGPDAYLLVVSFDPAIEIAKLQAFRDHYSLSSSATLVGPFSGRLDNEGDHVQLLVPDRPQSDGDANPGLVPFVLVDDVNYDDQPPWAVYAPDPTVRSLQRRHPALFGDDPAHWEAAGPTPARINPSTGSNDADQDGLPDAWEMAYGLDPNNPSGDHGPDGDPDLDSLTNREELLAGTHPHLNDTDGDGLLDGWESRFGLDPLNRSQHHGGEGDPDADDLTNLAEQIHGTNPLNPDSDHDLLPDAWEIAHGLNPTDATGDHGTHGDPDGDGFSNFQEAAAGTHPLDSLSCLRLELELLIDGRLRIRFPTVAGRAYTLETCLDLNDQPWTTLIEVPTQLQDSQATLLTGTQNLSSRFYRVLLKTSSLR